MPLKTEDDSNVVQTLNLKSKATAMKNNTNIDLISELQSKSDVVAQNEVEINMEALKITKNENKNDNDKDNENQEQKEITTNPTVSIDTSAYSNFNTSLHRIKTEQWWQLIKYCWGCMNKVLTDDKLETIFIEKNESGFCRINLPSPEFLSGAEKIRIHFWPTSRGGRLADESIHNHPKYFESFIVAGGYRHAIYHQFEKMEHAKTKDHLDMYIQYCVTKLPKKEKKCVGPTYLQLNRIEEVRDDYTLSVDGNFIHRVIQALKGSLSINVVFKDPKNKDHYDVFISSTGTENDVKTQRQGVSGEEKKRIIEEITSAAELYLYRKKLLC